MKHKKSEKGQAIILIVFAMIGLIGLTALTVDGGMAYDDRRHAQNAADSAAFAAALAIAKNQDMEAAGYSIASVNGYDNNGTTNTVTITGTTPESGACPEDGAANKKIKVDITSHVDTFFAPVVGIQTVTNKVTATTQVCGQHVEPLFEGNAVVSLNPDLVDCGIDTGDSNSKSWNLHGGGVFSNGCVLHENGTLNIYDDKCVSSVGGATVTGGGTHTCVNQYQSAKKYIYPDDAIDMMPDDPCTGDIISGRYEAGGKIPTAGQTTFDDDIFCISDMSDLDTHIVLSNSTLYVTDLNFDIKLNGGGAPGWSGFASGTNSAFPMSTYQEPYKGYFMVIAMPSTNIKAAADACNQNIEYRGNGNSELVGTILAPAACFDSRGNAENDSTRSQFIFYNVSSNGTADLNITYNEEDNFLARKDPVIRLLK